MKLNVSRIMLYLVTVLLIPLPALAENWQLAVGAQSADAGHQALAFLPNEIWIHAGDSVTWTVVSDEVHTITFLKSGQIRPSFAIGCPGFSASATSFDGSTCVSTPRLLRGQTFTVTFPAQGNYKLVCLVHPDMTGVVHVLDGSVPLPHDQTFYDQEADQQRSRLLSATQGHMSHPNSANEVVAGHGRVIETGGGRQTSSVMRFMQDNVVVHVGDTIEWTSEDSVTAHTITFGTEPANAIPPSANVSVDADGARHAFLNSPADSAHSGFIVSATQDRLGLPQSPVGVTRFRVTFAGPGTYPYICALHDDLGMKGQVVVLP